MGNIFQRCSGVASDIDDYFIKIFSCHMVPYSELADPAESVNADFYSSVGFGFHDPILPFLN
jgi:hypothetical protein